MTYNGTVQNGVIQLEGGVRLPEGAKVQIELAERDDQEMSVTGESSIGEKLAALGRWAESQPCDLPEDLAIHHDHYLYGVPKRE